MYLPCRVCKFFRDTRDASIPRNARDVEYAMDTEYKYVRGTRDARMRRDARDIVYAKDAEYASMSGIPGIQGCLEMPGMLCMPRMQSMQVCQGC